MRNPAPIVRIERRIKSTHKPLNKWKKTHPEGRRAEKQKLGIKSRRNRWRSGKKERRGQQH